MKNVLIVDNDLGFIFWLGQVLAGANYQPWPACNVLNATAMVAGRHLARLDLLILNPFLRGAAQFLSDLRRSQPDLKVLALGVDSDRLARGVNAWQPRPAVADLSAKHTWVLEIERVCGSQNRAA
jgi:hypothetical protein